MYIKARKKLLRKALETQNAKPVALQVKPGVVRKMEFKLDMLKYKKPVIAELTVKKEVQPDPVTKKLRGYKIKQVSPYKIESCAPSRLF